MSTEGKLGRQVLYSRAHSTIFYSHSYTYSLSLSLSYLWQERGYIYISGTLTKRTLESRHPDPEASLQRSHVISSRSLRKAISNSTQRQVRKRYMHILLIQFTLRHWYSFFFFFFIINSNPKFDLWIERLIRTFTCIFFFPDLCMSCSLLYIRIPI